MSEVFASSGRLRTAPIPEPEEDTPEPDAPAFAGPVEDRLAAALGPHYELGPEIGAGGMGRVFKARDLRLKRDVAVKILAPETSHRADLRKRFVREAQMAASLTHPNIVPIHDVGQKAGLAWFVMGFVQGESARDLVRRGGPQPAHVVARIVREAAMALSYAHARGVVHRDIKPDNIMIERGSGRALVMDFGLAKLDDEEEGAEHLTQPGGVIGTPAYMSPEQARGKSDIDHRTDIFSLGMVGYYMLSGRNPYEASNARAVIARVITEEPPDISTIRPDLPAWLSDALAKASQRDPEKRFEKAEKLAEALDFAQTGREIPASLQFFLGWIQTYIELSVLAAWFLWIVGPPPLPLGGELIVAGLLSLPILLSLQLLNAEGLKWPEIREGIVAWRLHLLRCMNLKRESGLHMTTLIVAALAIGGVLGIRWTPTILTGYESLTGDWQRWTDVDPGPMRAFDAAAGSDVRTHGRLFAGSPFALYYALLGSLVWTRIFGLPMFRRLSPQALDKVASWRIPWWIDRLGALLFTRVWASTRVIEATADLRQLSEPAVRAAIAFHRTKRQLPLGRRLAIWRPIRLGELTVKRLWRAHERLQSLRECARCEAGGEAYLRAIEKREQLMAECAAVLGDLRMLLEESSLPAEERDMQDKRVVEELKRVTFPLRAIALGNAVFVAAWIGVAVAAAFWLPPSPALDRVATGLTIALGAFALFQIFKRRIYS